MIFNRGQSPDLIERNYLEYIDDDLFLKIDHLLLALRLPSFFRAVLVQDEYVLSRVEELTALPGSSTTFLIKAIKPIHGHDDRKLLLVGASISVQFPRDPAPLIRPNATDSAENPLLDGAM